FLPGVRTPPACSVDTRDCTPEACVPTLLPAAYCLSAFQELLRFVQPALFHPILVSRRALHCLNTRLHWTGCLLRVAQTGKGAADQVQAFRIVITAIEKLLQRIARITILSGGEIRRADLAPDFVLRVKLIAHHNLFEVTNRFSQASLRSSNPAKLIM